MKLKSYVLSQENKGDGADLPGKTEEKKTASPADDVAALKARVADFEAKENQRALDQKKADDDAKAKALADGDVKKQLDLAQKELERLKAIEGDAILGKEYRERETKRISAAVEKLPEAHRALIDAQPTVALKAQLLDALTAVAGGADKKTTTTAKTTSGGAPAGDAVDFAEAIKDPAKWREAKERDPEGAASFFTSAMTSKTRDPFASMRRPKPNGTEKH